MSNKSRSFGAAALVVFGGGRSWPCFAGDRRAELSGRGRADADGAEQDGPVSKLPDDKKHELITCVNEVLDGLPNGKKRFVIEAASYDEMENRFGKVVMENRAEWKQRIARSCAHIVV